jgi:hypothetical protein
MLRSASSRFLSLLLGLAASCSRDKQQLPPEGPVEWVLDEALPFEPGTSRICIDALKGTGPNDIWALAAGVRDRLPQRFMFHFDGSHWTRIPTDTASAIHPVAPDDVWVVGSQGRLNHFDGREWKSYRAPGYEDFLDVWAAPDGAVWIAIAGTSVVRFQNGTFEKVTDPALQAEHNSIQRLTGAGGEIIVPVNALGKPSSIARLRGGTWTREEVGTGGVVWLAASAPSDVWAVSFRHQGFHFDGTSWTRHETSPLETRAVHVSPEGTWLAGEKGLIMRWDGTAWRHSPSGTTEGLWSIYAPPGGTPIAGGERLYRLRRT